MKILNKFLKVGKALIITQCLSFLVYVVFACACIRHSEYAIVVVVTLITTFVFASTILRTIAEYCKIEEILIERPVLELNWKIRFLFL